MVDSTSHAVALKSDHFSCCLWSWFCFHLPSNPGFLVFVWFSKPYLVSLFLFCLIKVELGGFVVIVVVVVCFQSLRCLIHTHCLHFGRTLHIASVVRALWTHTRRTCLSWSVGPEQVILCRDFFLIAPIYTFGWFLISVFPISLGSTII